MFSSMVNKVSGFWHSDPAAPSIEVNKPEDLTPEILKRYHDWFSANSNNEQVIQLLEDFQNNSAVRLGSDPQMCWQTLKNVMNHLENPRENIAQHLLKIVEQAFKTKIKNTSPKFVHGDIDYSSSKSCHELSSEMQNIIKNYYQKPAFEMTRMPNPM